MYVERDCRRQAPGKAENQSQMDYLSRCLEFLISRLVDLVPTISSEQYGPQGHPQTYGIVHIFPIFRMSLKKLLEYGIVLY